MNKCLYLQVKHKVPRVIRSSGTWHDQLRTL